MEADVQVEPRAGRERVVARLLQDLGHRGQMAGRTPCRREARARPLERAPRLQQLGDVDRVDVQEQPHRLAEVALDGGGVDAVDERAAATTLHRGDQPDVGERAQRLAHRRPADLEPTRLLELRREAVSGAQVVSRGVVKGTTDANGHATIHGSHNGLLRLRARHGSDIPSTPVGVCVNRLLRRCPAVRGKHIIGTRRGDRIRGTRGADLIEGRGGNDHINVVGGGRDRVRCGRGHDVVRLGRHDRAARDCEVVIRRF